MPRNNHSSGLSLVVAVDKPAGMTSHDVVQRCRRIFGERRIGHTGTLDPAATGVLCICVGPAARLDRFITGHDKTYEFSIVFGSATDTDDAEGEVIRTAPIPQEIYDEGTAREYLRSLEGPQMQMPPAYSAIKVQGKKAYEAAREGTALALKPRAVELFSLELLRIDVEELSVTWCVRAHVSAGTYVRSIARDAGEAFGSAAHIGFLRRVQSGNVTVDSCVSLDQLAENPLNARIDPLDLLSMRMVYVQGALQRLVSVGRALRIDELVIYEHVSLQKDPRSHTDEVNPEDKSVIRPDQRRDGLPVDAQVFCSETSLHSTRGRICVSYKPLRADELIAIVSDEALMAIYQYDASSQRLKSVCGFSIGVDRGGSLSC